MPQVQRPISMEDAVGADADEPATTRAGGRRAGGAAAGVAGAPVAGDAVDAAGAAAACGGAGEVWTWGAFAVPLVEELRLRRTASLVSRMVWRITTFWSLNRMTSSFCWTSAPPTNAPTYGIKFSALAVERAHREIQMSFWGLAKEVELGGPYRRSISLRVVLPSTMYWSTMLAFWSRRTSLPWLAQPAANSTIPAGKA